VLFVSHNLDSISGLCTRCALLQDGQLAGLGKTVDIVAQYLGADMGSSAAVEFEEGSGDAYLRSASLSNGDGDPAMCFTIADSVTLRSQFVVRKTQPGLEIAFAVFNFKGERIFYSSSVTGDDPASIEITGTHAIAATIPSRLLLPGRYYINIALHRPNVQMYDYREHVLSFEIIQTGEYSGFPASALGFVHVDVKWRKDSAVL